MKITSIEQLQEIMDESDIDQMFYDYVDNFCNTKLQNELNKLGLIPEADFNDTLPYKQGLIHCNPDEWNFFNNYLKDNYEYAIPNNEFVNYMIELTNYDEYEIDGPYYKILGILQNHNKKLDKGTYRKVKSYKELHDIDDKINDEYITEYMDRHQNVREIPVLYINGHVIIGYPGDIHDDLLEDYSYHMNESKYKNKNIVDLTNFKYDRLEWSDLNKLKIPTARAMIVDDVGVILILFGGCLSKQAAEAIKEKCHCKVYYQKPFSLRLLRKANFD